MLGLVAGGVMAVSLAAAGLNDADRTYIYSDSAEDGLSAYVFEPPQEVATGAALLMLHGGGWSHGSPAWVASTAALVAEQGIVGIPLEYRLSRGEVTPLDAFRDVCRGLAWARENAEELGVDPERIGFYGVSAGGHLAALTATVGCEGGTEGPALLVLYSPALNMERDRWFEKKLKGKEEPRQLSPLQHVGEEVPATLIVSGEADTLTPHRWASEFCDKAAREGSDCTVEGFEGAGHLLTRNLENQESDFDPAPEDVRRAREAILAFLKAEGFAANAE